MWESPNGSGKRDDCQLRVSIPPRPRAFDIRMTSAGISDILYITLYNMGYISMKDIVRELGYLTLGTRFKRIGEALQAQTQELLADAGIKLPASHFPLLAALDRNGSMRVGELTQAVGISQPGVTRMLGKLESLGLVRSRQPAADLRTRSVALSAAGTRLVANAKKTAWPMVEAAVANACADVAGPLLTQLAKLEDKLAATPLSARAKQALSGERKHART